jgi:hypothetical protein
VRTSPRLPPRPKCRDGPPQGNVGREPPAVGPRQRHFPPMPCRRMGLRQGTNHDNDQRHASFRCRNANCQYDNVQRPCLTSLTFTVLTIID